MIKARIAGFLSLLVVLPIWFYLMFSVLKMVGATDIMWLLYWVYVPVVSLSNVLIKLAARECE